MPEVIFSNDTDFKVQSDLAKVAEYVLKEEKRGQASVSISLVSSLTIRELNMQYRQIDSPTDVLSFCFDEGEPLSGGNNMLGEIYICPDEVQSNADAFKVPFEEEMCRVVVHGILHLLGYDHKSNEISENKMLVRQEELLGNLKGGLNNLFLKI